MAFRTSLTTTRVYTQADPYYYTIDNRPIGDLDTRDNQLADELDRRTLAIDITGAASATINGGPTGWSVVTNGTGDYTITHNLGFTNYIATGTIFSATGGFLYTVAQTTTTIQVKTVNLTGTATHLRFQLLVTGR